MILIAQMPSDAALQPIRSEDAEVDCGSGMTDMSSLLPNRVGQRRNGMQMEVVKMVMEGLGRNSLWLEVNFSLVSP